MSVDLSLPTRSPTFAFSSATPTDADTITASEARTRRMAMSPESARTRAEETGVRTIVREGRGALQSFPTARGVAGFWANPDREGGRGGENQPQINAENADQDRVDFKPCL